MKDSERTMIEARRNLTQKVMQEGKSEAEILKALRNLKYEPLITEIHNAENAIEKYAKFYHAKESECPDSLKFLMMINEWHNPFVALNELLKRIDTNEMILKRESKKTGKKAEYKSRYKEMRSLIQEYSNRHEKAFL